jgi:hypothetical protein
MTISKLIKELSKYPKKSRVGIDEDTLTIIDPSSKSGNFTYSILPVNVGTCHWCNKKHKDKC